MSAWAIYLDELEEILERTERGLGDGDLDAAGLALAALAGAPGRGLPTLPDQLTDRAMRAVGRLNALEAAASHALARLRPELAMLAGAATNAPATALFLDHSA